MDEEKEERKDVTSTGVQSAKTDLGDEYLVSWDGDADPMNPHNWSSRRKWIITMTLAWFSALPPLSSNIIAPAQFAIGQDLGVTNSVVQEICLSVFNLGIAFGPLVMSPLSEAYGRYPILIAGNLLFLAWNTGCGFAQNEISFIICRLFSGFGSTASLSIMSATMGEIWPSEKRATAIAIATLFGLLAPAVGPIIGGYVVEYTSWRWILWATSVANAVMLSIGIFTFRETHGPKLLRKKAEHLRGTTGNAQLHSAYDHQEASLFVQLRQSFYRPLHILGTQTVVQILCTVLLFLYGTMFLLMYYYPVLWTSIYHQSSGQSGLNYISSGVGFILGSQVLSRLNDALHTRLKRKNNNEGRPEFRLPLAYYSVALVLIGLLILGWSGQYHSPWIIPNIGNAIFLAGSIGVAQIAAIYTVEAYSIFAASALSSENFVRSVASFGFPLFAPAMFDNLGWGIASTILGAATTVATLVAVWVLQRYGQRIRSRQQMH